MIDGNAAAFVGYAWMALGVIWMAIMLFARREIWKQQGEDLTQKRPFSISRADMAGPENPLLLLWSFPVRDAKSVRLKLLLIAGRVLWASLAIGFLLLIYLNGEVQHR